MAFVYCFFLMEETNYDRKHTAGPHAHAQMTSETAGEATEKTAGIKTPTSPAESDTETGSVQWPRKSYLDKLSIKDKKRQNRFLDIIIAPFKGFTYPSVVYAG